MDLILLQPGDTTIANANTSLLPQGAANGVKAPLGVPAGTGAGCIEIVSLHSGMKQQLTTDVSNQARTSGRPIITEMTLVKYVDASSTQLYNYCLNAQPIGSGAGAPTIIYLARNSAKGVIPIMTIQLKDAIISEIQLQSHPNDMPTEQFKLNFTEILWTFTVQANDSNALSTGGQYSSGWSLPFNTTIGAFSTGA